MVQYAVRGWLSRHRNRFRQYVDVVVWVIGVNDSGFGRERFFLDRDHRASDFDAFGRDYDHFASILVDFSPSFLSIPALYLIEEFHDVEADGQIQPAGACIVHFVNRFVVGLVGHDNRAFLGISFDYHFVIGDFGGYGSICSKRMKLLYNIL